MTETDLTNDQLPAASRRSTLPRRDRRVRRGEPGLGRVRRGRAVRPICERRRRSHRDRQRSRSTDSTETDSTDTDRAEATTPGADAGDTPASDEADGDDIVITEQPVSPYDRPGRWYVLHTQSGYENKVRKNIEARISSMNMEERIFEVVIPMEDVVEFKNGKKVVVQKKVFPGYLLCRMKLNDDSWFVVRNTPGVTGFVGAGNKPSPLAPP